MGEESVDLRKEIAQAKEQINSPDDALADYVGERKSKD